MHFFVTILGLPVVTGVFVSLLDVTVSVIHVLGDSLVYPSESPNVQVEYEDSPLFVRHTNANHDTRQKSTQQVFCFMR